ncbi:PREDICTED: protein MARD1-like [Nelumbo nucifera]|uniref:Protein MARD1-like n=2 Tax=Nelumbo nucifera TaxID=4432 RepID=A0A1U7Z1N6_NELNU|nr:PREDICTED: protein MARD1-like [Nelumbo nucifera]DAD37248.1 TPA_asm: hypothetical protein HUJ06_007889 [Nelumbo nucifera]
MRSMDPVGLRILIQCSRGDQSNTIVKSAFRLRIPRTTPRSQESDHRFLKSCHLCQKQLSPMKDVYMYRGDECFCSEECRCRQIFLDEMREIKASTKEMLPSSWHCGTSGQPQKSSRRRRNLAVA